MTTIASVKPNKNARGKGYCFFESIKESHMVEIIAGCATDDYLLISAKKVL